MKKLFLIIGAPGSGKTTDAELIAKRHENITHYSTGDMLRAEMAKNSDIGKEIAKYVNAGLEQMSALDEYLKNEKELELLSCIEVVVSEEVAKDRVLGRNRGDDDKVEVFNNRMSVYIEPLKAIQDFYESKNILKKIDGERTIEEIVDEMESFILSKIV